MIIERPTGSGPALSRPVGQAKLEEPMERDECRGRLIGVSPRMVELRALVSRIACVDSPVLISGECGSGKRTVAEAVHFSSSRSAGPLLFYPCHAGSPEETERELFEERLLCAAGGTLVLEEVTALPIRAQIRLLGALQERTKPGFRVIATTVTPLAAAVAEGRFRNDLYFVLNVVPLEVPPLRERMADLPLLMEQWRQQFCQRNGVNPTGVTAGAIDGLRRYSWPGNLRELESALERAAVMAGSGRALEASDFAFLEEMPVPDSAAGPEEATPLMTLEELERRHVLRTLEHTRQNRTRAAGLLNISVRTLRNKLHQYRNEGFLAGGEAHTGGRPPGR